MSRLSGRLFLFGRSCIFLNPLHASTLSIFFAEVLPYPFQVASFLLRFSSSKEQTPPLTDPVTEVDV